MVRDWGSRVAMGLLSGSLLVACGGDDTGSAEGAVTAGTDTSPSTGTGGAGRALCSDVDRGSPYPPGIPWAGVHAGPANDDFLPCDTADEYVQAWRALEGLAVAQPSTFSPDGRVLYVTTANPQADGCRVHALDVETGAVNWCITAEPDVIGSSVEVDADGLLYLTAGDEVRSLQPDGSLRWATEVPVATTPEVRTGAVGLHFTPDGHVATVTNDGIVLMLSREDGAILASLDLKAEFGFVPASGSTGGSFSALLPPEVVADFEGLFGDQVDELLGVFFGSSPAFSDNTLGIAPDGTLFVVGGGIDVDNGSLMQVSVGGTVDAPTLSGGWYVPLMGGSATSPSISPDGRWVSVGDGQVPLGFLSPSAGNIYVIDIEACDANSDGSSDEAVCGPVHRLVLPGGAILGSPALLDGPVSYTWDVAIGNLIEGAEADVTAWSGGDVVWRAALPDNLNWTSTVSITNNHVFGTGSSFTDSGTTVLGLSFPGEASHELLLLSRSDGSVAFRAPVPDDGTASASLGPDGSIYVNMLALLSSLSLETRPSGGVVKFSPVYADAQ